MRPSNEAAPAGAENRATRFRFVLGLAAVAAIAGGSIIGALVVRSNERDAFERRQREEALRAARQAEALTGLSVGQLASAAAFYQTAERLTRHRFEVMAQSLLRTGALSGTGLVLAVPGSHRSRFERDHGHPIVDRGPIGFRHAPARALYYPLAFAASDSGLEPPLGYDVGADAIRRPYLLRARDSGTPTATRVMHLPLGGTGINVFRPVYRDGAPTATVTERRAALNGFAVGAFHIDDLTAAVTSALSDGTEAQLLQDGRTVAGPDLSREDIATAPIRIADRAWFLVVHDPNGPGVELPVLMAVFGISLAALLGALVVIWSRNERMEELQRQASYDSLTGLKNRRRFEEELREELARSRRYSVPGALLILDLDRFKQVNDTLGHAAGDRVIGEVATTLRQRARETDVLARLGGDEFAIVLPRCGLDQARVFAAEIGTEIRERTGDGDGVPAITASIGIAPFEPAKPASFEAVLARADAAMYAAKGAGRDTVRTIDFDGQPGVRSGA